LTLICDGSVASHIGACCIGDVLHVRGVRVDDMLICESAKFAMCAVLAPGWEPVVDGYVDPPHLRRAA
jgi:hypothetical protein